MPLHVEIKVNEKNINSIHIGRMSGGTNHSSVNTYMVVMGEKPTKYDDWMKGVKFTHTYGDGAEICVMKAIQAVKHVNRNQEETWGE